jgi:thiol:disulfide interchange protein
MSAHYKEWKGSYAMTRTIFYLLCATAILVTCCPLTASASDDNTQTIEPIYDTTAVATVQIAEALADAKATDREVLIQWGANWCKWCRLLHGMLTEDSLVHQTLESRYVWVLVDVGRKNKNLDLMAKYKVDPKKGIPYLTVLDTTGAVVINQETGALETHDKEHPGHDPGKVVAFLKSHSVPETPQE